MTNLRPSHTTVHTVPYTAVPNYVERKISYLADMLFNPKLAQ
ncbi:hypothetical protein GCM10022410_12990 [Amphibacillus indicireducens]|uniref:Uncharacterized protein n=1 Tax=Amphibacillus indicireducens TaxID=1076330 RepID=A0ABP7VLF1_9BACI